jgi:YgiT-type zinc finger domain-containing protein
MKSFRKRLARSGIAVGMFAAAFLVLLPIMLPVAVIQNQMRNRRILKLARDLDCASCGARLGAEAIQLGAQRWAAIVTRHHALYPGTRLRLVRDVDAVCPRCGREYSYQDADRSLILKPNISAD